jgi:hypothetical protein
MTERPNNTFCGRTRREFLWQSGAGFTSLGLTGLLASDGFFTKHARAEEVIANNLDEIKHHHAPKAKSVIFLFMYGGPSHVDTFDYKPQLAKLDGQTIPVKTKGRGGSKNEGRVVGNKWNFKQYGESGQWVSDLFPHVAKHVDDIAFLKSMTADSPIHGSAMLMMNSGKVISGSPCMGSWVNYGLGSENKNLPGFVVMLDPTGGPISGAKNWSSGYMPATYAGTIMRSKGAPLIDLKLPEGTTPEVRQALLAALKEANEEHANSRKDISDLAARIKTYELAYQMQSSAPEAVDLKQETQKTLDMYGVDKPRTDDFGRRCLIARRLVERGVRFIQLYSGGAHNDDNWDAHGDLKKNHDYHAGNTDKPIAALLQDLKDRGLFDSTLVIWGGEFGRQPTAEYAEGTGRDHNSFGFTMWLAGGGIKGGQSVGATDELGAAAIEEPMHVKRLHATVLWQMGINPNHLSYFYGGLDQKLVGVEEVHHIKQVTG